MKMVKQLFSPRVSTTVGTLILSLSVCCTSYAQTGVTPDVQSQVIQQQELDRNATTLEAEKLETDRQKNKPRRRTGGPSRERLNEIALLYVNFVEQIPDGATLLNAPYPQSYEAYGRTKPKYDYDSDIVGGAAMLVNVKRTSKRASDQGAVTSTVEDFRKGDIICLTFWARIGEKSNSSEAFRLPAIGLQGASEPYPTVFEQSVDLTEDWSHFSYPFKATHSFNKGEAQIYFHYGNIKQSFEIGPVYMFNLGVGNLSKATGKACKA